MKNKKSVLICFAILALLCLGIGFASLVDNLTINANVNITASDADYEDENVFEIYFIDQTYTGSAGVTVTFNPNAVSNTQDASSFSVAGLNVKDETVTITYKVGILDLPANYDATLSIDKSVLTNSALDAASVTTSVSLDKTKLTDTYTNDASQFATITIVITLNETLVGNAITFNDVITVKATAVAE